MRKSVIYLVPTLFILVSVWIYGTTAMAIEEPSYEVIEKSEQFEIRHYAPVIVAEVVVDGDMSTASSRGFRLIAGYIFGKNSKITQEQVTSRTSPSEGAQSTHTSEKIAMTVPVTVEPQGTLSPDFDTAKVWRVQFTMPKQFTLDTLPIPSDPAVKLRQIPGKRFAAMQYTGLNGEEKVSEKATLLLSWLATKNITPLGPPQLARYNPPWSLPFLRRNEILVEIAGS